MQKEGDALAPGAEQVIRQLVQVPLAGAEAGFHLQHGGEGHQAQRPIISIRVAGPPRDEEASGRGQHAGAYGGAGNQQGTTQGLGIHVIHPKVRGAVANKESQLAVSGDASGKKPEASNIGGGDIVTNSRRL